MFHVLLIIFFSIDFSATNDPILIASPYPFNTSKSTQLECFSNDQGIIQSLVIVATRLDKTVISPSLQSSQDNITKNESILLTIPASFNYSQLHSPIECRSKYHHGIQKIARLEVLSVPQIAQEEFLTIATYTKRLAIIHCRTYGTDVSIHWDFTRDSSKSTFSPLPIGIRMQYNYTLNDTLIIEHVSYSLHHGYYRCVVSNSLLNRTYEERSIVYLNVRKDRSWILIVILLTIFGICILIFLLCAKYHRKKRKGQHQTRAIPSRDDEQNIRIEQVTPVEETKEFSSDPSRPSEPDLMTKLVGESKLPGKNVDRLSQAVHSIESLTEERGKMPYSPPLTISKRSPQFALGNPFLDPNAQSLSSVKQFLNTLESEKEYLTSQSL